MGGHFRRIDRLTTMVFGVALAFSVALAALSALAEPPHLSISRATSATELPFWKNRPDLMTRIVVEREVVVAVKRRNIPGDRVQFTMAGVGQVARAKDFCFRTSQHYEKLPQISDHFKEVRFDAKKNELFIVAEALGYEEHLTMRIVPVAEEWRSELQWEVILGHFKGMTGLIGFERKAAAATEMSIQAKYEAKELPLPRALMGFALEVIMKKVAEKMRDFIETQPAEF